MTVSNIVLEALDKTVKAIKEIGQDYCLFGGLAMQAYKRIRATMDVDLMVAVDSEKINDFILSLERRGFRFDTDKGIIKIKDFKFLRFAYCDKKYEIEVYIDCVTATGIFQKEILRRKKTLDIFGLKVNVASCEDLILLKVLASRPLDRVDARVLIEENAQDLDRDYLKKWAKELGIARRIGYMLNG